MKPHFNEDALIKYQFDLCDKQLASRIAEHLQGCQVCTAQLEKVKQNFAALDLLKEDESISAKLIEETVAYAKQPRKARMIKQPLWLSAAAVLAVCALLALIAPFLTEQKENRNVARTNLEKSAESDLHKQLDVTKQHRMQEVAPVSAKAPESKIKKHSDALAQADKYSYSWPGAVVVDAGSIPDRAPFAPASAIELVVLPKRENIQLTIYNSADLTLVRERRNLTLKAGWNWLQFMWANTLIDPTSLRLEPLEHKDKIDVQELVYPAGLKDIGRWLIRSEVQGQVPFEITYFTSGLKWRAFYTGTLAEDEKTMNLDAYVRVANNSGEDYEDAQTRLIVGNVNLIDKIAALAQRRYPFGGLGIPGQAGSYQWGFVDSKDIDRDGLGIITNGRGPILGDMPQLGDLFAENKSGPREIKKQGLSEYFLYTIEGRETITNKWAKRLPSFQAEDIPVESLYKYDEERYGSRTMRYVSFANDTEHELGDTPIPDGAVKVYRNVSENGNLSYVGGTDIKYIPVNEKIELSLGANRLVKIQPVLMDQATENYVFDRKKNISGYDEVELWKLEVTNSRKLAAKIEITRWFGPNMPTWDLVVEDEIASYKNFVDYKKHDAERARFTLTVPAETKRVFYYRLRKYHGRRSEYWAQRNIGIMEGDKLLRPTDDGNFTLYVSNQSLAMSPVDIAVYVDGMKLLDKEFNVSGENSKIIQHNWKRFKYKLGAGKHTLRAFSTRGDAKIETKFKTGDKNWAVLNYSYRPENKEKKLIFTVHDKQVYFE
jgi:hypothetical protein